MYAAKEEPRLSPSPCGTHYITLLVKGDLICFSLVFVIYTTTLMDNKRSRNSFKTNVLSVLYAHFQKNVFYSWLCSMSISANIFNMVILGTAASSHKKLKSSVCERQAVRINGLNGEHFLSEKS